MWRVITLILCLIAGLMLVAEPADALTQAQYEKRIVSRINAVRANHDLKAVAPGPCVDKQAERWARLLRTIGGDLFHQSMGGIMDRCNAEGAGEIAGAGDVSPRKMVRLWMNSPGHRAVILNGAYERIGVGAVQSDSGRWWVVADFIYHN